MWAGADADLIWTGRLAIHIEKSALDRSMIERLMDSTHVQMHTGMSRVSAPAKKKAKAAASAASGASAAGDFNDGTTSPSFMLLPTVLHHTIAAYLGTERLEVAAAAKDLLRPYSGRFQLLIINEKKPYLIPRVLRRQEKLVSLRVEHPCSLPWLAATLATAPGASPPW